MSNLHYKHIQPYEKQKLEKLIGNVPTLEPKYGTTNHGWGIVEYKFLININLLATSLGRTRRCMKRELWNIDSSVIQIIHR
ncbi:MAG: hypothetical protein LBT17_00095 [Mycoplasmataceae bacterium]|nr:hypothetical protein [Mycoplasmataceae bacterium]